MKLVGVVLVSHSPKLAEGLAELVRELGGDQVPVIAAGGMDDGSLGTSYGRIERAVSEADQGAGVLLLGDLGSALLTVKTLLDEGVGQEARAVLADAPFVEGAVAAVVTASAGGDLESVRAAAEEARLFRKL
ncbi:PTS-dependent dihydroxyacetone kinase phosphotransferase subunit DhaM [Actinospica sp. MGRD01-02]|uniref:phosphoenolpyruvate--glycerone phosphotransferase n=1 Tax=Actinospica acidithermotolerans TaxID=2828514 RepID=A0A941IKW6_9ACTN|nr:dihydroxyacetone kinase phosphoryl donor subunit DhaM [Actinospica acidithermotolerans]MBR7831059.1 PTS-dependent dihydroxyacetone kinase phosphotransferase subunit DhaM [Actinospica acidithermotolerans]